MKLIKLHFVGFVDEGPRDYRYIDRVLYDPVYIRADKIVTIYPHEDDEYPVPKINKQCINEDQNVIDMVVGNFAGLKDYKQASIVTFETGYTACLKRSLRYNSHNPYKEEDEFIIYESPKEMIRLINGEDVPLEVSDPLHNMRIKDFDFTVRTENALKANGIETAHQLIQLSEYDLFKMPLLGKRCIEEIKAVLAFRDLKLKP